MRCKNCDSNFRTLGIPEDMDRVCYKCEFNNGRIDGIKIEKNVLLISDDFGDRHFETVKSMFKRRNGEDVKFNLFLAETFRKIPKNIKIDIVLVDYGFIDNCFNKIEYCLGVLDKFYLEEIPLMWCGGLYDNYNDDAKGMFPRKRYLHNLPSTSTSATDMFYALERFFKDVNVLNSAPEVKV